MLEAIGTDSTLNMLAGFIRVNVNDPPLKGKKFSEHIESY
jgi:hypothetical protein